MGCDRVDRYAPRGLAGAMVIMALALTCTQPSVAAVPAAVNNEVQTSLKVSEQWFDFQHDGVVVLFFCSWFFLSLCGTFGKRMRDQATQSV